MIDASKEITGASLHSDRKQQILRWEEWKAEEKRDQHGERLFVKAAS
jgi:hypothetical protein